jgi:ABC-type lipoprotein release transport system permease subunit
MLAGRYLRAKRQHGGVALISVISVVAITLAVMALIITMSVMNGFRETLLSRILGVNGHVYVDVRNMPGVEIERMAALVREAPGVTHVTPIINAQALATVERWSGSGRAWCGAFRAKIEALSIVADSIRAAGGFRTSRALNRPAS